jgi:glycosyltransferase involved in cell wall biosynthesis
MSSIDISVILNLHSEGILAHPTMLSVREAVKYAKHAGIEVEVLVVVDSPDNSTQEYVDSLDFLGYEQINVGFSDSGRSRNAGIEAACGKWVAFIDGDDLWGKNWLVSAYHSAEKDPREIVWHPAVNVYFGTNNHLFPHIDMEDPRFDIWNLAMYNYWTALSFAKREFYLSIPYPAIDLRNQLGHEDWSWNIMVIEQGGVHKIVQDTTHVIRQQPSSRGQDADTAQVLQQPTDLFKSLVNDKH